MKKVVKEFLLIIYQIFITITLVSLIINCKFTLIDSIKINVVLLSIIKILLITSIFFVSLTFTLFIHELGHILFGLISKYKLESISILNIQLSKRNVKYIDNLKLSLTNMRIDNNSSILSYILYCLGGILFNLIFIIVLLLLNNFNLYILKILLITNIYNITLEILNPFSFENSDMFNIISILKDKEYIENKIKERRVTDYLRSNNIEEMSEQLIFKPNIINNENDLYFALLYIDSQINNGNYEDILLYIEELNKNKYDLFTNEQYYVLMSQKLLAMYLGNKNIRKEYTYQDNEYERFLSSVAKKELMYLKIEYIYYMLVKNNKTKAKLIINSIDNFNDLSHEEIIEFKNEINNIDEMYKNLYGFY